MSIQEGLTTQKRSVVTDINFLVPKFHWGMPTSALNKKAEIVFGVADEQKRIETMHAISNWIIRLAF